MQLKNQNVLYEDVNLLAGDRSNLKVRNAEAINQNIASIFDTVPRSKWHRPEIGCLLNRYLYEPIDSVTASSIKRVMKEAIGRNGEWRVVVDSIEVTPMPREESYYVEIRYSAPQLDLANVTYSFNFDRGAS